MNQPAGVTDAPAPLRYRPIAQFLLTRPDSNTKGFYSSRKLDNEVVGETDGVTFNHAQLPGRQRWQLLRIEACTRALLESADEICIHLDGSLCDFRTYTEMGTANATVTHNLDAFHRIDFKRTDTPISRLERLGILSRRHLSLHKAHRQILAAYKIEPLRVLVKNWRETQIGR